MGVDVLPYDDPLRVGMIGTYGNRWANIALVAARLPCSCSAAARHPPDRCRHRRVRRGRQDPPRRLRPGRAQQPGHRAARRWSQDLAPALPTSAPPRTAGDARRAAPTGRRRSPTLRAQWPDTGELPRDRGDQPERAHAPARPTRAPRPSSPTSASTRCGRRSRSSWSATSASSPRAAWARWARACRWRSAPRSRAAPGRARSPATAASSSTSRSSQTVVRNALPLKIVILNNGCHGMVRQFQETYFDGRYQSTVWGYSAPDFAAVAARLRDRGRRGRRPGRGRGRRSTSCGRDRRPVPARGRDRPGRQRLSEARLRPPDHRDGAVRRPESDGGDLDAPFARSRGRGC